MRRECGGCEVARVIRGAHEQPVANIFSPYVGVVPHLFAHFVFPLFGPEQ